MVVLEIDSNRKLIIHNPISIPIWCDWKLQYGTAHLFLLYFNSYMVRLEALKILAIPVSHLNFNSYMVRLEETLPESYVLIFANFNSYMVRLECSDADWWY